MKCVHCKNHSLEKPKVPPIVEAFIGYSDWCSWHDAFLSKDVVELDSAEKDCLGFEAKAEVSR